MQPLPAPSKTDLALRRALQRGLIAAALACVATKQAVRTAVIATAIVSIVLIALGALIHSAPTLGVGVVAFSSLLIVFRRGALRGLRIVSVSVALMVDIALTAAFVAYTLACLAVVAGGVWIDRFSLSAAGGVALLPVAAYLAHRAKSKARGPAFGSLPPEGHLLTNRLKTQEEAKADAQELF